MRAIDARVDRLPSSEYMRFFIFVYHGILINKDLDRSFLFPFHTLTFYLYICLIGTIGLLLIHYG
jgi:hypothetical protein